MIKAILEKTETGIPLSREEALELLSVRNLSPEYFEILKQASGLSRRKFGSRGYIFVQIGLNVSPCSGNCSFCSLAQCNSTFTENSEKTEEEILQEIAGIDFTKVTAVFLMTTADYSQEKFLQIGRRVRQALPSEIALVANTGDFDGEYARAMRAAGFTGVYHIVRLREGTDTALSPELRIQSLDAARDAGLRLYYCLEPIGPEHSYAEMVTEMLRAREYHVDVMAAMRRVSVQRTHFAGKDMVDDFEMAKIVAVTRMVSMPRVSMNVHEPNTAAMLAGVNQLYAELGANPRDDCTSTEDSRGLSVDQAAAMLESAGYHPCVER